MKNIEWLKEAKRDYLREEINSIGSNTVSRINIKINDIIDQLDEPETLSKKWIENHTASAYTIAHYSEEDVPVVTVYDLENLLVPKLELPVIPDYVAEYIKNEKESEITLDETLKNMGDPDFQEIDIIKKTSEYVKSNIIDFIDAYRDGYTVEEKKYYILLPKINRNWLYVSLRGNYDEFIDHYTDSIEDLQAFTEKEIKAIEPRYFAFAVPAEELEE